MKKFTSKLLSILLTLAMVLSMIPSVAFATGGDVAALTKDGNTVDSYGTIGAAITAYNNSSDAGTYVLTINNNETAYEVGDLVIEEYENKPLTIKAESKNGVTLKYKSDGTHNSNTIFNVSGKSSGTGSLTFEDIKFDLSGGAYSAIRTMRGGSGQYDEFFTDVVGRYARNITCTDCTFTGDNTEGSYVINAAAGTQPGNFLFDGCTVTNVDNFFSGYAYQSLGGTTDDYGIKIKDCTVTNVCRFLNNQATDSASIVEGCTVSCYNDYAIRTAGNSNGSRVVVSDSWITNTCAPSKATVGGIVVARSSGDEITIKNCVFTKPDGFYDVYNEKSKDNVTIKSGSYLVDKLGEGQTRIGELSADKTLGTNDTGFNFLSVAKRISGENTTNYYSLQTALSEAKNGDTVKLLVDTKENTINVGSGITLDTNGKALKTTNGWTLADGSVTNTDSIINGDDVTAMAGTGTVNGTIYAPSGTLDLRGVDLRIKGEPLLCGGTSNNKTTLDTLKATRVFFGDIYDGGGNQTIKNIILEDCTTNYRAALGVYYDSLTVDNVSVNASDGWYWDQQYQNYNYNYQMYTGYGGTLNINKSLTTGEYMNASSSLRYIGTTNLADGAVLNCLDFQNTGNVTEETKAAGTVHVNGYGATLNAAALNNHAITSFGTVNLTSHPVLTTVASGLFNVNYGTDAVLTIGSLNFLNLENDTTKSQLRAGDNAKTIIGRLTSNPDVGADFYVTGESESTVNKDGGNLVQYTGDIVFTKYSDSDTDNTKFSLNLDSSDDYFTGSVRGTQSAKNRWGKWSSAVMGDESEYNAGVQGMTLKMTGGSKWNITGDSIVNNLSVYGSSISGKHALTVTSSLALDATGKISVTEFNNSGTITVDMTGATDNVKLIDCSGTADYGTYEFAEGKDNGFTLKVVDNDLYAVKETGTGSEAPTVIVETDTASAADKDLDSNIDSDSTMSEAEKTAAKGVAAEIASSTKTEVGEVAEALAESAVDTIIEEAKKIDSGLETSLNDDDLNLVTVDVSVNVEISSVAVEQTQTTSADTTVKTVIFTAEPVATVTTFVNGNKDKTVENVPVSNDYFDGTSEISVTLYVGDMEPQQIVHVHDDGSRDVYEKGTEATTSTFVYDEAAKTVALKITGFSKFIVTSTLISTVKIGDRSYASLQDAIDAASAGDTIVLQDDSNESVTVNKEISIKLNGHSYTGEMTVGKGLTRKNSDGLIKIVKNSNETGLFIDVTSGLYFYNAVYWALNKGITSGIDLLHFSPNSSCTRAQMVTFLWRAAGSPDLIIIKNPFLDVSSDDYYYTAVLWAVQKGVVKGTSATTFSPNESVKRCQAVTFLARMNGVKDSDTGYSHSFLDVGKSEYYSNAVAWAASKGITSGTTATLFSPYSDCLRCQIVTFLYRCFN